MTHEELATPLTEEEKAELLHGSEWVGHWRGYQMVRRLCAEIERLRAKVDSFDAFVCAIQAMEPYVDLPSNKTVIEALLDTVKRVQELGAENERLRKLTGPIKLQPRSD